MIVKLVALRYYSFIPFKTNPMLDESNPFAIDVPFTSRGEFQVVKIRIKSNMVRVMGSQRPRPRHLQSGSPEWEHIPLETDMVPFDGKSFHERLLSRQKSSLDVRSGCKTRLKRAAILIGIWEELMTFTRREIPWRQNGTLRGESL